MKLIPIKECQNDYFDLFGGYFVKKQQSTLTLHFQTYLDPSSFLFQNN